jgi:hypothetical protein
MVGLAVSDHPAAWSYVNEASPEGDAFQGSTMQAVRPSRQLEEDHANGKSSQLLFTFLLRYNIFL